MMIRDRIKSFRRVKASELLPNPRNWRTHPTEQRDAMRGLLAEIGFAGACLVRETRAGLQVIDGHLRAEEAGDGEIPCLVLDVTKAEAEKLLATFDPVGAMAGADSERLGKLLAEIDTESEALQAMLDGLAAEHGSGGNGEPCPDPEPQTDRAAELQKQWKTELGQVWEIAGKAGVHRVMCGDSTKAEDVGRLMEGVKAGLCFTSPPYAQQRDYTKPIDDWDALMQGVFGNLPMADAGQVLVNLGLIHRNGEWVPYWEGWIEWMRSQGWRRFGWYVWDQCAGLPGDWSGRLAPSHEWVFHFNKTSLSINKTVACLHAGEVNRGKGLRGKDGVVKDYNHAGALVQERKVADSVLRITREKRSSQIQALTVAPFPVQLPALVVDVFSQRGDALYDPFLGSGTTLIAAEQLGRVCYGMEIEPKYVAVILQRAKDAGLEPQLASATESQPEFAELFD